MLDTTKTFENNNTIYFEATFRKANGALSDVITPTYLVENSRGTSQSSGTPTKKTTGIYYVFYTPDTVGDFEIQFSGTIETYTATMRKKFKIVDIAT